MLCTWYICKIQIYLCTTPIQVHANNANTQCALRQSKWVLAQARQQWQQAHTLHGNWVDLIKYRGALRAHSICFFQLIFPTDSLVLHFVFLRAAYVCVCVCARERVFVLQGCYCFCFFMFGFEVTRSHSLMLFPFFCSLTSISISVVSVVSCHAIEK